MKRILFPLSICYFVLVSSCSKEELTIIDSSVSDSIFQIIDNPWFPMDTNDMWIYDNTNFTTETRIDGDELVYYTVAKTFRDTIKFHMEKTVGNYRVRRRDYHTYNTQVDKLILILDDSHFVDKIHVIPILYTEVKDTNWTHVVSKGIVVDTIRFYQRFSNYEGVNCYTLHIPYGGRIGLLHEYIFIKGVGFEKYFAGGGGSAFEGTLIEYIDN